MSWLWWSRALAETPPRNRGSVGTTAVSELVPSCTLSPTGKVARRFAQIPEWSGCVQSAHQLSGGRTWVQSSMPPGRVTLTFGGTGTGVTTIPTGKVAGAGQQRCSAPLLIPTVPSSFHSSIASSRSRSP